MVINTLKIQAQSYSFRPKQSYPTVGFYTCLYSYIQHTEAKQTILYHLNTTFEGTAIENQLCPRNILFLQVTTYRCYQALCVPCSKANVMVGWSHTSLGPKYWIGPG